MDDFPGILTRDFGFRPQGKSAPMKPTGVGSGSARSSPTAFDDIFGGTPPYPNQSYTRSASASSPQSSLNSVFDGFKDPNPKPSPISSANSMPVFDKPVYDDDIFDGIPRMKSSVNVEYNDVFGSMSPPVEHVDSPQPYDDLLASIGKGSNGSGGFDDLIPGFGGSSPPKKREHQESNQQKTASDESEPTAAMPEDPFVVLETTSTSAHTSSGLFTDPLEQLGKPTYSGKPTTNTSSVSGGVFDDIDAFNGFAKSIPSFTSEINENRKEKSSLKNAPDRTHQNSSSESFDNVTPNAETSRSFDSRSSSQSPNSVGTPYGRNASEDQSPKSSEHLETADDVWLTVSEVPLFTKPTSAPPPSRPPPQLVIKQASIRRIDPRNKANESFSQSSPSYHYQKGATRKPGVSSIDELEDFAMGKPQTYANEHVEVLSSEEDIETNSPAAASAAAMKEAMDKAEAKFKHAKEVRGRERDAKSSRRDEKTMPDTLESEDSEKQENLEHERLQSEREEREEQKRLERERDQELARERLKARQAVERATKEARERAAAEARLRAERAAVEKANAEARQRAERHAVQRAAAEARERAAAEARERAERAAAEAREKAAVEAREKASREKAAVNRAAAEARVRAERASVDRAQAEARERAAAAAAREKQQKAETDLDSFFGMGARTNSTPTQRATTPENIFDTQAQNRGSGDGPRRPSSTSSSTVRKASSTTNIVDDLSSIFGATPSSGDFQEVEGESEERRRARLERHQRTLERAEKALAEKNERDMQAQREQAERHRIGETLDIEIKRWAAGKEGNLRALLSTLQYVLWPECGWQPVSLTDLITGASVKKVYRKATLCIHPDKVQQKGATLQQKYIAEKVFDLLKEAWNKFNSEELF